MRKASNTRIKRALEKLRCAYQEARLSHNKYAIYIYLKEVHRRVHRLVQKREEAEILQELAKTVGREFRSDTSLASALIQLTSSETLHKQVRSKWAQVIYKAIHREVPPEKLMEEVRKAGGMNKYLELKR